jgi:hypothetical protein
MTLVLPYRVVVEVLWISDTSTVLGVLESGIGKILPPHVEFGIPDLQ